MTPQDAREDAAEETAVRARRASEWWQDIASVPEPAELVAQCDAIATERARGAVLCTDCGRPKSLHGFKASNNGPACVFTEGTGA